MGKDIVVEEVGVCLSHMDLGHFFCVELLAEWVQILPHCQHQRELRLGRIYGQIASSMHRIVLTSASLVRNSWPTGCPAQKRPSNQTVKPKLRKKIWWINQTIQASIGTIASVSFRELVLGKQKNGVRWQGFEDGNCTICHCPYIVKRIEQGFRVQLACDTISPALQIYL